MCYVYQDGEDILYKDGLEMSIVNSMENNLLMEVFKNSKLTKEFTLKEIRNKLHKEKF